jgi:hypothetical protein
MRQQAMCWPPTVSYSQLPKISPRYPAQQIERIATGWRLKPIAAPLIVRTHAQTPEEILRPKHIPKQDLERCRELGATLAAGIALGIF